MSKIETIVAGVVSMLLGIMAADARGWLSTAAGCACLAVMSEALWSATGHTRGPGSWWVDNSLRFLSGVLVGGLVVILAT